jgi:hypothetical protein
MSDSPSGDPPVPASADGPGILAGLPRTRPQRASARRVAARTDEPSAASPRRATKRTPTKPRAAAKKPAPTKNGETASYERAPRQGFETEPDPRGPVQPPGGTELVVSAAELAGELAKTGVTVGARVLRDFLSRLPG